MQAYLVERIAGSGENYVRYVDCGFSDVDKAREYADKMNKESKEDFNRYLSCEFIAVGVLNELFLSYIRENDRELYDRYNDVMDSAENHVYKSFDHEEFEKKKKLFRQDDEAFSKVLAESDISDYRRKNLMDYRELHDLYHDGLPVYRVNPTPIEVYV